MGLKGSRWSHHVLTDSPPMSSIPGPGHHHTCSLGSCSLSSIVSHWFQETCHFPWMSMKLDCPAFCSTGGMLGQTGAFTDLIHDLSWPLQKPGPHRSWTLTEVRGLTPPLCLSLVSELFPETDDRLVHAAWGELGQRTYLAGAWCEVGLTRRLSPRGFQRVNRWVAQIRAKDIWWHSCVCEATLSLSALCF